jgi:capsular polysaccharide biosynthesis protein
MDITLKDFLSILKKNSMFIIICTLAGLAAAFSIAKFAIRPTYVSTVKLYVYTKEASTRPSNDYDNLNNLNYAQKIVNTYIEMLRTNSFYKLVKDNSSLDYSIDELKDMIKFEVLNDTEVFQVSVSSHKPEDSKQIADSITSLAPKTINSIMESAKLKVVDSPSFPTEPSSPHVYLDAIVGLLIGLIISVIISLMREMLDIRIRDEEDIASHYNIPILGSIPAFETNSERRIVFQRKEDKK